MQLVALCLLVSAGGEAVAAELLQRRRSDPPGIVSSWDDLLEGVKTREDWRARRKLLKQRYLDLIRDEHKPAKPPLELQVDETVVVNSVRNLADVPGRGLVW